MHFPSSSYENGNSMLQCSLVSVSTAFLVMSANELSHARLCMHNNIAIMIIFGNEFIVMVLMSTLPISSGHHGWHTLVTLLWWRQKNYSCLAEFTELASRIIMRLSWENSPASTSFFINVSVSITIWHTDCKVREWQEIMTVRHTCA